MKRSHRSKRFLFFIPLFLLGLLAITGVVMLLWNNVLSPVLHVSTVTFWQGMGILVLSKILFSSFGGGRRPGPYYRKQRMMWECMTPEQKEKFREEWKTRGKSWGYGPMEGTGETQQAGESA